MWGGWEGGVQATSHGVTPLKIEGKQKLLIQSSGFVVFFMLVLFFFSAEAMTRPQNSDMYVQHI